MVTAVIDFSVGHFPCLGIANKKRKRCAVIFFRALAGCRSHLGKLLFWIEDDADSLADDAPREARRNRESAGGDYRRLQTTENIVRVSTIIYTGP